MYAIVFNNQIVQYPANPRVENPSVSFPVNWSGGSINGVEYVTVQPTTPPSVNIGWACTESTPIFENNSWVQTWTTSLKSKREIKQLVSNKRFEVEVGGVVVGNNVYATDRGTQSKYVVVGYEIQQSNTETWSVIWKARYGNFITLNATEMTEVINSVRNHVQQCFNKEKEYYDLIDTANNEVLESTDFSAGWPSNS